MKILLMGFTKIKYMPYMNFYLENLDRDNNEIHILYWNRDLRDENVDAYTYCVRHEFRCYQEDDVSKAFKIKSFINYRKYAKKVIKEENFDFIIVLHSLPGVLLTEILRTRYTGRYIFDYRDSTYEGFAPFKKVVGKLVEHSAATFVSSDAFRCFLPEQYSGKIYTSHNLLTDALSHRDQKRINGVASDKIRISFWGFIRHEEINRALIKKIAADSRFELHYYGREQQVALNLKHYAAEIGAENVFFHGEYKPEDRYEFVRNTDIIHNIYKDVNTMLAMGNKYYDGIIFRIPQLCMSGSFMAQKVTENEIGFSCNPEDADFTTQIYNFYSKLDKGWLAQNCDKELQRVLTEYETGKAVIQNSITKV